MLFIDVAPNRPVRSPFAHIVRALFGRLRAIRGERKRRAALRDLLFMPEHRLRDLGLRREELLEALERRHAHPGSPDRFN